MFFRKSAVFQPIGDFDDRQSVRTVHKKTKVPFPQKRETLAVGKGKKNGFSFRFSLDFQ